MTTEASLKIRPLPCRNILAIRKRLDNFKHIFSIGAKLTERYSEHLNIFDCQVDGHTRGNRSYAVSAVNRCLPGENTIIVQSTTMRTESDIT